MNDQDPAGQDSPAASLDAADAALAAAIAAAEAAYAATIDRLTDGLLLLVSSSWEYQPGQDETTCPIPVEAALAVLGRDAVRAIDRLTLDWTPGRVLPRVTTRHERARIVEEARMPWADGRTDDRVRDCVRVNPARFLAARRLLTETVSAAAGAAVVRDAATAAARAEHARTCGPLYVALARESEPVDA